MQSHVSASGVTAPKPSLTDIKSSPDGLSLEASASGAQRKGILFKKVLKEEFLRELQYLWDVTNGHATPRDTMTEIIVKQLKAVTPYIPQVGAAIHTVVETLGGVAVFAANGIRDERMKVMASLKNELDFPHLEILLEVVVQEVFRRYESFIVDRLGDNPETGVIPFARVGARRMLEKLSRSGQGKDDSLAVSLNESTLLAGLIEGRSGAWIEGFSNHELELKRTKKDIWGNEKPKTITAEDVYARPGFRRFEVQGKKIIDELYIREKAKHQELPDWKKAMGLFKGDTEAFYQFGFVRFRKTDGHRQDPKAGYVLMPLAVIKDRYDFRPQDHKAVSGELQKELRQFSSSILCIDRSTIGKWYLPWMWMRTPVQKKGLLDYVHQELKLSKVARVICRDDLNGLNLKGSDFSHTDLSGAILSGDLSGVNFSDSYLIGVIFQDITSLRGALFYRARCEFLTATGVNWDGANLTQAHLDYANLYRAQLRGCKTLGTTWQGADLREVTSDSEVLMEQKNQMLELKKVMAKQRQKLRDIYREMQEQSHALQALQRELSDKVTALGDRLGTLEARQQLVNEIALQVQQLMQQQENAKIFQTQCINEIAELRQALSAGANPDQQKLLQTQIQELQQQLLELKQTKPPTVLLTHPQDHGVQLSVFQAETKQLQEKFNQALKEQQQSQAAENQKLMESLAKLQQEQKQQSVASPASPSQNSMALMSAPSAEEEKQRLLLLQNQLITACEQGDEKTVQALLKQGAKPDAANEAKKHPLGAAVWGMNPAVVNALLQQMGGVSPMDWKACEAHNKQHYKEVFIVPIFAPQTFAEWNNLLLKMEPNSFIRAYHLSKVDEAWRNEHSSSWENLRIYVDDRSSGLLESDWDMEFSRGAVIRVVEYIPLTARLVEEGFVSFRTQIKQGIETAALRQAAAQPPGPVILAPASAGVNSGAGIHPPTPSSVRANNEDQPQVPTQTLPQAVDAGMDPRFHGDDKRLPLPVSLSPPPSRGDDKSLSSSPASVIPTAQSQQRFMPPPKAALTPIQLRLQNQLIMACEQGDEKAVQALLKQGAKPDVANEAKKHPLGAAVWGMNPAVVNALLAQMGGVSLMDWEACKAHNRQHYGEIFIVSDEFEPQRFDEWHTLLQKMDPNPFIRAYHLSEVDKAWHDNNSSSWENLKKFVAGSVRLSYPLAVITMNDTPISDSIMITETGFVSFRTQIKQGIETAAKPRAVKTF